MTPSPNLYILYRGHQARIIAEGTHTVTLIVYGKNRTTVEIVGKGVALNPSENQLPHKTKRIVAARRTEPLWKKFKDE